MAVERKELTPEQEQQIVELFRTNPNIEAITKLVFQNDKLDGRSWQGKLVAKFLVDQKLNYKTTKKERRGEIRELTADDKEYIISAIQNGDTFLDVARVVFQDDEIKKLSSEWRKIQAFCEANGVSSSHEMDDLNLGAYAAPKELDRLVNLVNRALGTNIDAAKGVNGKYKACFDRLRINLDSSRFKRIINAYEKRRDRDLFVDEFVRLTFEKPDLTPDEINLYLQIVRDSISLEVLEGKINKLNAMFLDIEDASELNQRFSENLKACVDEKNQVTKRIADTTKKLQGDRAERLKSLHKDEVSILTLINLAQEKEEREQMLRLAEMQKALISEEANKFENLDSWVCRVLGVSKEEVI